MANSNLKSRVQADGSPNAVAGAKASAPHASDKRPYAQAHYLLFGDRGGGLYREVLDCAAAKEFLEGAGVDARNPLTQSRHFAGKSMLYGGYRDAAERQCDFCGRPITGVEYDKLRDGRDRCALCSETVVSGQENFEELYHQVREGLMEKFGIELPANLEIKVVSAKKIAKAAGSSFTPSAGFAARVVGLAVNKRGKLSLLLENGAPRLSLMSTAAHELTHIWQYSQWDAKAIKRTYGKYELAVYEGMAKWVEVQFLYLLNETAQAERIMQGELARTDVYGMGLRLYLNEYPLSKGIVLEGDTPFDHGNLPLKFE